MRTALALLVLWSAIGCASMPTQARFAEELVTPEPPARGFRSIGEEINVDQEVLDIMRSEVEARDEELLALLHLAQGVHPYLVLTFVEKNGGTDVLATSIYWGRVQGKWLVKLKSEDARTLVEQGLAELECSPAVADEALFGAALIHWLGGSQETCKGGWFLEEGSVLGPRVQAVLDEAQVIYEPR